jgi:hypothetical protein
LPLLATQQYQKALSHLADAGGATGILQAAHLGLILVSAGVPVGNLGQPEGPDNVVAALLVAYSNKLISDPATGSLAALEYIARIPNKTQARRETAALIAKPGETERLVGSLNDQELVIKWSSREALFEISALLGSGRYSLDRKEDHQKFSCWLGGTRRCALAFESALVSSKRTEREPPILVGANQGIPLSLSRQKNPCSPSSRARQPASSYQNESHHD